MDLELKWALKEHTLNENKRIMKYSKVLFLSNILTLGYLIVPIFYLIFIPEDVSQIVNLLYYTELSYVIVNILALLTLIFWIQCFIYWNKNDKKISTLLCLIFFTALFTPFYYLFQIRRK